MKYKLYGLYSGDELVYVGKIEDTAQAVCDEFNLHLAILEHGSKHQNYMYEYMLERREEGQFVRMTMLNEVPGKEDIETVRLALVYALRPIGNWYEWHWTEEEEGEKSIIQV